MSARRAIAVARSWLGAIFARRRFERDLDDELRFHLEEEQERAERAGMTPGEARALAYRSLGASTIRVKEECRDRRGLSMIDDVIRDLMHGARLLRRSPGFSAVVLTTLAVAIGATVTVFSTVDAWLLRPLRFTDADRLVIGLAATRERPAEPAVFLPYRAYVAWKDQSRAFDVVSAAFPRAYLVTELGEASTANGLAVTPDFFETLGVPPMAGRILSTQDVNGPPAVVLSYGLWERQFGASAAVVDTSVTLNGVPHQVVGVMPGDFDVRMLEQTRGFELWTLFASGEAGYAPGGAAPAAIIGRLRDGVRLETAQADVSAIHARVEAGFTPSHASFIPLLTPLQADNTRAIRATLVTIGGAVLCLLLIACLNVGTLVLGRGLGRAREAAIRVAIGASRGRLVRQLLAESLLLCATGGFLGLALALVATRLYASWDPLGTLPPNPIGVDVRALGVAIVVTALSTALCGVWPALRIAATEPVEALRSGGDRGSTRGSATRAQAVLLGGQMAMALLLLVATALLVRTFIGLQREPLGFGVEGLTVASLAMSADAYDSSAKRNLFSRQLAERLRALPGVQRVAAGTSPPLSSGPGLPVRLGSDAIETPVRISTQDVTIHFFETVEIPLLAGRGFEPRDSDAAPPVVVLNERAARMLFGVPQSAIGRTIRIGSDPPREVIGIVGTTRSTFFNRLEWLDNPVMYLPAPQAFAAIRNPTVRSFELHVHIRSDGPIAMSAVRTAVTSLSPRVAVVQVSAAWELAAAATRQPALRVTLLTWFAGVSLMLAAIGVYGLVAQGVAGRARELGVRVALGASPGDVVRTVTVRVFAIGALGVVAGSVAALLLANVLEAVLYGVGPTDFLSFAAAGAALMTATGAAASIPAWRATRIDPVRVLRAE